MTLPAVLKKAIPVYAGDAGDAGDADAVAQANTYF